MAINWNLLGNQQGQFQNALAMGAQFGAAAAERRNKKEYTNALLDVFSQGGSSQGGSAAPPMGGGQGIVATPEQQAESERLARQFGMEGVLADDRAESMAVIARQNPQLFVQLQQQAAAQQQAANLADLTARAVEGDSEARSQLLRVNYERWSELDEAQKTAVAEEQEVLGQAALYALNQGSPDAIRQAVIGFAQQTQSPEVMQIAQLPDDQLVFALRKQVFESDLAKDLISNERPNYLAVPNDATLVNTRDPSAVSQFGQGAARQVVRTGKDAQGRTVVQYSDGSIEYAGGAASDGSGGF